MVQKRDDNSRDLSLTAVDLINEKKGLNTILLEVSGITYLADYFLLCTGTSAQHVQTLCDHLKEGLKEAGVSLLRIEGYREARWVLLDYGILVIHVFQAAEREFYNLERLWSNATEIKLNVEESLNPLE